MRLTIHRAFVPYDDPEASLRFYRDTLGFDVREDVGSGPTRRIVLGAPGRQGPSLGLQPPATGPGITDEERRMIVEVMRKGGLARIVLATSDLIAAFERVEVSNAEVIQEPIHRASGTDDCAFLDPAGNIVHIQQAH